DALDAVAAEAGRVQAVSIRINPVAAAGGGAMRMGGKPTAFGFDEEDLEAVVRAVEGQASLALDGVHMFAGTQILDADVLALQWRHGLAIASRVAALVGRPLAAIDLGGGLGIPYHPGDAPLDLSRIRAAVPDLDAMRRADPGIASARVVVEPGRYLVGAAGVYIARVTATKVSRGRRFAVTDGGMHHHLAASGNLGQVIKRDYPVVAANRMDEPEGAALTVVGPLCTPLDVLARQGALPDLGPGDLVAVLQSGAYGLTASPVGFLSHDTPAEVLVDNGRHGLIRRRARADERFD
ncbi:MAG TPA: type III PLP-dependent enzyme, partial [Methylomirabilota bacterium]|nr:type III PLP-dependent enzyme [Methylomirabilota bacterium]